MADEQEDVKPDSSTGQKEPEGSGADSSSVTQDVTPQEPGDRPFVNFKAEFDRKLSKVERQLQDIAAALAARPMAAPEAVAKAATQEPTDNELLELALQGHREAMAVYVQRQAQKTVQTEMAQQRQALSIEQRMAVLLQKYPVFRDGSHPLTQYAIQVKAQLLASGKKADRETDFEAMLTAVADNPDIVAEIVGKSARARESTRQGAVQAQAAVGGATHKRTTTEPEYTVSEKAAKLAERYGVKDPAKAKQRFMERQTKGSSSVSPIIAVAVREEA